MVRTKKWIRELAERKNRLASPIKRTLYNRFATESSRLLGLQGIVALVSVLVLGMVIEVTSDAFRSDDDVKMGRFDQELYEDTPPELPLRIEEYPFVSAYDSQGNLFNPGQFDTWSLVTIESCISTNNGWDHTSNRSFYDDAVFSRDLVHVKICTNRDLEDTPGHYVGLNSDKMASATYNYTAVLPPVRGVEPYELAQSIFALTAGKQEFMRLENPFMYYIIDPDGYIRGMDYDLHLSYIQDRFREFRDGNRIYDGSWTVKGRFKSEGDMLNFGAREVLSDAMFQRHVSDSIVKLRDTLFDSLYWFRDTGFVQGVHSELQETW